MLYVLPIEPLKERYSKQWLTWTERELKKLISNQFSIIMPVKGQSKYHTIGEGAFLDVCKTHVFKFKQLQLISQFFVNGKIKDGDVIWLHDMWFPGIEALAYMRQGTGIDFKIAGCLHAGTYDPNDFLTQKGMLQWGKDLENSWFSFVDYIFVATNYHKKLVCNTRNIDRNKVYVTGFPLYLEIYMHSNTNTKNHTVVFPHRLDQEKQPFLFDQLKNVCSTVPNAMLNSFEFIKTKDAAKDKIDYYRILKDSKFAVSFALQETWGIAMQESVLCSCIPIVPNRLSYTEMYNQIFQFDGTVMGCIDKLNELLDIPYNLMIAYVEAQKQAFIKSGSNAIPNMLNAMGLV